MTGEGPPSGLRPPVASSVARPMPCGGRFRVLRRRKRSSGSACPFRRTSSPSIRRRARALSSKPASRPTTTSSLATTSRNGTRASGARRPLRSCSTPCARSRGRATAHRGVLRPGQRLQPAHRGGEAARRGGAWRHGPRDPPGYFTAHGVDATSTSPRTSASTASAHAWCRCSSTARPSSRSTSTARNSGRRAPATSRRSPPGTRRATASWSSRLAPPQPPGLGRGGRPLLGDEHRRRHPHPWLRHRPPRGLIEIKDGSANRPHAPRGWKGRRAPGAVRGDGRPGRRKRPARRPSQTQSLSCHVKSAAHDGDIVMIDSSCARVHQHGAAVKKGVPKTAGMAAWDAPGAD